MDFLLGFAACRQIKDDNPRLKCFDELGVKKATESGDNKSAKVGGWSYTESKSPVDDSNQVTATLEGEPSGAALILRCWENKTEAVFIPPELVISGTNNRYDLIMRVGDNAPTPMVGVGSTNGRAVFIPSARAFIELLPDQTKLFIRATGFQGRFSDGAFTLADISGVRSRVADTCHWSTVKAAKTASPVTKR